MPAVESHTFKYHFCGKSLFDSDGMKWLVVPRTGPPDQPVKTYIGQPNRWMVVMKYTTATLSPKYSRTLIFHGALLPSALHGTCDSPSVKWFVLEWCTEWLYCQEKYGTRRKVCRGYPTKSFNHCLRDIEPWPHSCPSIHTPVAIVPLNALYIIQTRIAHAVNSNERSFTQIQVETARSEQARTTLIKNRPSLRSKSRAGRADFISTKVFWSMSSMLSSLPCRAWDWKMSGEGSYEAARSRWRVAVVALRPRPDQSSQ